METSSGARLRGIERLAVFNRLRARFGLQWELPPLLASVVLTPGARCLEIGAGLGWGTVGLLRNEASVSVVTTDYEGPILRRARAFVQHKQPTSRVSYAQVDAKSLPFSSDSFDLVLSLYVLHHAAGYRSALREIARVLTSNGILLMIDLMRPRFAPQLPVAMAPHGVLTGSEWRESFASCGLDIVHWRTRYLLGPLPRCSVVASRAGQPSRTESPGEEASRDAT